MKVWNRIARMVADGIVKDLFENGAGQQADRLVLELRYSKNDGGGYCRGAVKDLIVKHLTGDDPARPTRRRRARPA